MDNVGTEGTRRSRSDYVRHRQCTLIQHTVHSAGEDTWTAAYITADECFEYRATKCCCCVAPISVAAWLLWHSLWQSFTGSEPQHRCWRAV